MMIMPPPPPPASTKTMFNRLLVAARDTGNPDDAPAAYKVLYGLQPISANGAAVPIPNASHGRETSGAKEGFQGVGIVGLQHFDQEEAFLKTIDMWVETIAECPDAIMAAFSFQGDARPAKKPGLESAMCHHDLWFWQ